MNPK